MLWLMQLSSQSSDCDGADYPNEMKEYYKYAFLDPPLEHNKYHTFCIPQNPNNGLNCREFELEICGEPVDIDNNEYGVTLRKKYLGDYILAIKSDTILYGKQEITIKAGSIGVIKVVVQICQMNTPPKNNKV